MKALYYDKTVQYLEDYKKPVPAFEESLVFMVFWGMNLLEELWNPAIPV